jgi:hypothetical protein
MKLLIHMISAFVGDKTRTVTFMSVNDVLYFVPYIYIMWKEQKLLRSDVIMTFFFIYIMLL